MGFLLKEALKTLCGRNQWSYAVFWKIGCHNTKLLIWEECYYEPLPCAFPSRIGTTNLPYQTGEECWFSSQSQSSQLGIQDEDRVSSLINKMTVNSSVGVAGEGIIGRAAFTGNHQWILLNNFTRDAYPPEVYAELHYQFSAGMQTVAVIPVLPHGIVQLGSFLPIMENMGFVNDVKSLILQLGCVPGALISEDYSANLSIENLVGPAPAGVPLPVDPSVVTSTCIQSVVNGTNQQSNSSHTSGQNGQTTCPSKDEIYNCQGSVLLTTQAPNLNQISKSLCHQKAIPMSKTSFAGQQENKVVETEGIPPNLDSCLQQHSVSHNARSAFNGSSGFGQSSLSDCGLKYMEQRILSVLGSQDHANPSINSSHILNMSQPKTEGGLILDHSQSSTSTPILGGIPIHTRMSSLLRTNQFNSSGSKSPHVSAGDFTVVQEAGSGLKNNDSTKSGSYSLASLTNQSITFPMPLEGSDQKTHPVDLKPACDVLASPDQRINNDLFQALNIPTLQSEEHMAISGQIPGFFHDCLSKDATSQPMMQMIAKHEPSAQPLSGDDLFDVLGADFKNKLLNGNWNRLHANANAENMDKKPTCGMNPEYYSANEAISESAVFSGTRTDNLLDAVVSRTKSLVKQNSDDLSCKTTLTRDSTSSVPSHNYRKVISDHFEGELFEFPKNGGKTGAVQAGSLRSECSKDDAGSCSQTTSIHGSQLGSWVENCSNVKRESSVSTGYSKRPDEVWKGNRKRLKPGENPRPRPKDRQMIQDRVKELREIVPNGAKCSIDALLERTIKHMLFLQSVTKHADKLKQTGESKIVNKEGGLRLKDNFEGGATWAYEFGSKSMVCPIIVEDLDHPRQMLVEMVCEERGFFLEIADLIRGLGLTILKGVMEAHNDKIWARFAVEANRDVTRMEIFMSLVRLLEQTVKGGASSSSNAVDNKNTVAYNSSPQTMQIGAIGRPSSLH